MFRKNKNNTSTTVSRKESIPTIITRDMHILGNIVHDNGMVDFDGTLDGNIRCEMLTVRANGFITGEITANTVHVYGKVQGLIKAKNVYLYAGCHIEGIVMHEQISIEDGAFIDGTCKPTNKPASAGSPLPAPDELQEKPVKMLENIRLIR